MALIYNSVLCNTLEDLELQMSDLSEEQKQMMRNDFNGVSNQQVFNPVPQAVTSRQMHKALALSGKLSLIKSFIASLPEPNKTLVDIEFNQSNEFQRTNPTLNQMAAVMGMTSDEIDQLFIYANTL